MVIKSYIVQYDQNRVCIMCMVIVDQMESIATLQESNMKFHTPFEKVAHEYSMIVGVEESVHEFFLIDLKEIIWR